MEALRLGSGFVPAQRARNFFLAPTLLAVGLSSMAVLSVPLEARAAGTTPSQPVVVEPRAAEENAGEATEAEGPERIIERQRWFRERHLGPNGEVPRDGRNRALAQLADNLAQGILGAQPESFIPGDGWGPIGPTPLYFGGNSFSGRVTSIAVHPTDPNIAYIGAAQGGVWKTTDHGVTWTALTDTQASLAIGSVAIDPTNPSVVYAGTGEANNSCDSFFGVGILKSSNDGATWSILGAAAFANSSVAKIIVHPTNPSTLWAATTEGVGGFACLGPPAPANVGVWRSIDGGSSWTRTLSIAQTGTPAETYDLVIDPANANVLYAGVYHSGIWKTTDGGSTWTRQTSALPPPAVIGRVALAIHPTSTLTLYALFADYHNGTQFGGTYKTTNGGASWSKLNAKPTGSCQIWSFGDVCTYSGDSEGQCWYDLIIGVAPDGGVWAGGTGLWRSANGGNSWSAVCPSSVHVDQHALAFRGTDVWLGNDGGVFTSINNGGAWTSRNPGLSLTQFYPGGALHPSNPAVALGGAQDNGMLRYDGTPGWTQLGTGDGNFTAFDFTNPAVLYMSTQLLTIQKFNGVSWSPATNGLADSDTINTGFLSPFVMCPNQAQTLIAGSDNVWRTTNGAGLWSTNSPDPLDALNPTAYITTLAFAPSTGDCGTYFAGNNKGRVFRTTSAGAGWTDITSNLPGLAVSDIAVDPTNAARAFVALSGFGANHLWSTTNALAPVPAWFTVDAGLPDAPANAILIDPTALDVLYAGTDLGVFRSTDGGAGWGVFMGGHPNAAVFDLVANPATGVVLSYTHGRGVFKLGTFCNDGNACTSDTYDQILGCQHVTTNCPALDQCHSAGTCNPATGACSNPIAPEGTACEDGDLCTLDDTCRSGSCTSGSPLTCVATDACHLAGVCDSGSGACSNPERADGSPCEDGNLCTLGDGCLAGACVGGNATTCSALDACHSAGTCDTGTGVCSNPNMPDGTGCNDGNGCTTGDACTSGTCAGTPVPPPALVDLSTVSKLGETIWFAWSTTPGATAYDLLRGKLSDWPVGSNPPTEVCFADLAGTTSSDATPPDAGEGYWYLLRAENACASGSYGLQGLRGAPSTPRISATCP